MRPAVLRDTKWCRRQPGGRPDVDKKNGLSTPAKKYAQTVQHSISIN